MAETGHIQVGQDRNRQGGAGQQQTGQGCTRVGRGSSNKGQGRVKECQGTNPEQPYINRQGKAPSGKAGHRISGQGKDKHGMKRKGNRMSMVWVIVTHCWHGLQLGKGCQMPIVEAEWVPDINRLD